MTALLGGLPSSSLAYSGVYMTSKALVIIITYDCIRKNDFIKELADCLLKVAMILRFAVGDLRASSKVQELTSLK